MKRRHPGRTPGACIAAPRPGCATPMVDPRDRTQIRLIRSVAPRGDYTVPEGRYGVGPEELLRLDCTTGAPLGVVRR